MKLSFSRWRTSGIWRSQLRLIIKITNHKSHSTEDQAVDNASFKMVAIAILNLKVRTYSFYKTDVKSKFPINNQSHSTVYPGCIMFLGYPSFYLFVRNLSRNLMDNAWEKWPETQHADVAWQSPELIRFWSWAVKFRYFSTILTVFNLGWEMGSKHFLRTHGRNVLQFDKWIYPKYL